MSESESILRIAQRFFEKAALVILQARGRLPSVPATNNKWFNLVVENDSTLDHELVAWSGSTLPPLVIETFLDLRSLSSNDVVSVQDSEGHLWTATRGGRKTEIVLERWLIELDPSIVFDEPIAQVDKNLALLFRLLYTMVHLLPTYQLVAKLEDKFSDLTVGTRIINGSSPIQSKGRVGLSKPIIGTYTHTLNESHVAPHLTQKKLSHIGTALGQLRISVSYRNDVDFSISTSSNEHKQESQEALAELHRDDTFTLPYPTREMFSPSGEIRGKLPNEDRLLSISPTTFPFKDNAGLVSVSPQSALGTSPLVVQESRRLSRVQPFKTGSIGTQIMQRTPSGASIIPSRQRQSSTTKSNASSVTSVKGVMVPEITSNIGSAPKYSSSFGKTMRRSSVRRSMSIERQESRANSNAESLDELVDFMKLLDSKPDLRLNKGSYMNINDSLIRFQSMKSNTESLTESMRLPSYSQSPYHRGSFNSRSNSYNRHGSHFSESDEEDLMRLPSARLQSVSPQSINSIPRFPFRTSVSQPTTMATTHYAKPQKAKQETTDDEDLMFVMSDMNLSKN